jgi:hypothetical protein
VNHSNGSDALPTVKASFARRLKTSRAFISLVLLLSSELLVDGHEVITTKLTWAREVSRIFYRRCTSCHRKGGSAFDLTTYEQVRPWAVAIKEEVLERRMPPWGAVKGFGDFRNDDGLTDEEIAIVSSWTEGGAPRGDERLLPEKSGNDAQSSAPPKAGALLTLNGELTLKRRVVVAAIRPEKVPEGASLRLIAERPDGSVEPLIWLYKYASRFVHTYYLRTPLSFGAGTRFRMEPAIGSVSLLLHQR